MLAGALVVTLLGLHYLPAAGRPVAQHHADAAPAASTAAPAAGTAAPRSPNTTTPRTPVTPRTASPSTRALAAPPRLDPARWRRGLTALQTYINNTLSAPTGVVTPANLQSQARLLRRCTPRLASLGSPPASLRSAYQMAAQACGQLKRAAACYLGASGAYDPDFPTAQFKKLLDCGDTASNTASLLIGEAVATGDLG